MATSSRETIGQTDGLYDENIRIVSKNKVALRAFTKNTERIQGGIILLEKYDINTRMNKYEITDIGKEAIEETGLKIGDIVCADQLARFYDTFPVSVIKYDSIVFKTDKDDSFIEPLKGWLFVELNTPKEENHNGIIKLTDLLPIGTITHINTNGINNCDLNIGDKVLLNNDCDVIVYKGKKIYAYKYKDVAAKIEEE